MNPNSGILLVNKESGRTSFDVCHQLQRVFFTKQIGHTGTLDPNATGLLVVLINQATKALPYLKNDRKTYVAEMRLGKKTDTGEIWGNIIEEKAYDPLTSATVNNLLESFIGKQQQTPPMYSAIKVNGKKLYEYARANQQVEVKKRDIEIFSMQLISFSEDSLAFKAEVSSGTYIRTLCEDMAERHGSVGSMSALQRIKVGNLSLDNAYRLEDVTIETPLIDIKEIIPFSYVEYENTKDIYNGRDIFLEEEAEKVLIGHEGSSLAVYIRVSENRYHCERGLW